MHIAEMAHLSQVVVEPGPDDWFPAVDISRFIQKIDLTAAVGDATVATLHVIKIDAEVDGALLDAITMRDLAFSRWGQLRRWWYQHGTRFRTHLFEVTTVGNQARRYAGVR